MSSNNSFISWKHDASHDESISLHAQNGGKFGINLLLKLLKVTNIGKVKNALGSEVRLMTLDFRFYTAFLRRKVRARTGTQGPEISRQDG